MSADFAKFNFFEKLNYGTHHMSIYGAQVNWKWTGSEPEVIRKLKSEVECEESTSAGRLRPAIFGLYMDQTTFHFNLILMRSPSKKKLAVWESFKHWKFDMIGKKVASHDNWLHVNLAEYPSQFACQTAEVKKVQPYDGCYYCMTHLLMNTQNQ